jgi:hypothetical protein
MEDEYRIRPGGQARLHCLACGYGVGVDGASVCPECGYPIDERHAEVAGRRAALLAGFGDEVLRHAAAWLGVLVIYSIGAAVVGSFHVNAMVGGAAMPALLAVSVVAGLLISLPAAGHERRIVMLAWFRALWWMHGPWLMIGPATLIIFAVASIERLAGTDGQTTGAMPMVGLEIWVIACFVCLGRATFVLSSTLERHSVAHLRENAWGVVGALAVFAMLGVMLAAGVLGLAGGALGSFGAIEFANVEAWMD